LARFLKKWPDFGFAEVEQKSVPYNPSENVTMFSDKWTLRILVVDCDVMVQTPDANLSVRHKELKMTNMTSLPLTAMLNVKYPFQVSTNTTMAEEAEAPVSDSHFLTVCASHFLTVYLAYLLFHGHVVFT